ncbi:MAG: DUF6198 family protein [Anaerovoracaceae bacterium]|nr:DUF6198 family protein [Bacillota bacterium]MDY5906243.1 DUF6198 family protein [Anaerovoracaceae bacterium]
MKELIKKDINKQQMAFRLLIYAAGLIILACGITMNTKTGMGVSPIISVPYSISEIWGLNFGNMTFIVYTIFVIIQAVLMRRITLDLILQLPLSLVFTRFLNLFDMILPESGSYIWEKLLMLAVAISLTGIGIIMSVRTDFVPNPGDGIVNEIAIVIKKSMGFTKNCFDLLNLCISCSVGMIFAGHLIGIGLGTVLTMLLTGRAVALFSFIFLKPMLHACGLEGMNEQEQTA